MHSAPPATTLRRWSYFLYAAGLWNLAIATQAFFPELHAKLLLRDSATLDELAIFYMQLALSVVALMGVGYIVVGLNPRENRAILGLGIAGKVVAFVMLTGVWWRGLANASGLLLGFGDLLWAVGFVVFLAKTRATQSAEA